MEKICSMMYASEARMPNFINIELVSVGRDAIE